MMSKRTALFLFPFFLLFLFIVNAKAQPHANQINDLLNKTEILSPADREKLKTFISQMRDTEDERLYLENLSKRILDKIQEYKFHLEFLLDDLQRLVDSQYSKSMVSLREIELVRLWDELNDLKQNIRQRSPDFKKYGQERSSKEYMDVIRKNIDLLIAEERTTVPYFWEDLKRRTKSSYDVWNRKAAELDERKRQYQYSKSIRTQTLSYDEQEFLQVFRRMQGRLHRLSPIDSSEF